MGGRDPQALNALSVPQISITFETVATTFRMLC